jgi:hypothetical protein
VSDISAVSSDVALLREGSRLLRQLARPVEGGDSVKKCQRRVYRLLKTWSFNRVRDLWRPDPRIRIKAREIEQLRALARQRSNDAAVVTDLRALQHRIERLEQLLEITDPAMHSPSLAAARQHRSEVVRALGPRDRS